MTINQNITALVTGANKGIGFETARQLVAAGWTVWLGARDADRGRDAVSKLQAEAYGGSAKLIVLDVTDDSSVAAAVDTVAAAGGLDVLVNNAGIAGRPASPADTVPADFLPVYGVNVLGPVRVTNAFLPLLRKSAHPRIVNVSSGMGSFAVTTDPDRLESTLHGLVYPSSKTALNMITTMYAKAVPDITVNAVDPGYTETDLNGRCGTQPVGVGAAPVVRAAMAGPDGPTGTFTSNDGTVGW
jgi:NAD(P)-dependent dehydrogenase (short-subunit alcohol dehydrogenase family)